MSQVERILSLCVDMLYLTKGGSKRDTAAKTARLLRNAGKNKAATPTGAFDPRAAGAPPDYAEVGAWVAHPARGPGSAVEDANHLAAEGVELPAADARPCDCFYVVDSCLIPEVAHPFIGDPVAKSWNVPLGSAPGTPGQRLAAKVREQMEMRVAAGASCFNRTCRVYAPAYRQVSITALMHLRALIDLEQDPNMNPGLLAKPGELRQAFDLAYDDIRRAFTEFVDDAANAGRPFVIAAHSQGAMHALRLLQQEVESHPERRRRFVHAYLAGTAVPLDVFSQTLRHIRPSASARDTCSVSSWRTAAPRHPDSRQLRTASFYAGSGWRRPTGAALANNPISWSAEPGGPPSDALKYEGALWPLPANICLQAEEGRGRVPSGAALRCARRSQRSQAPLGVVAPALREVDCGQVVARVDEAGVLRVPHLPKECVFGLTERDWLLYHDLDFALFHRNLQSNVALRVEAWRCADAAH